MDPMKTTTETVTRIVPERETALTQDQFEDLSELGLKWRPFRARGWTYEKLDERRYKFVCPNGRWFVSDMDFETGQISYFGQEGEELSPGVRISWQAEFGKSCQVTVKTVARAVFSYERLKYQILHDKQEKE